MEEIKIEQHEDVALLRLDNKVSNAISSAVVENLSAAVNQIKTEFKGLVLAGGEKVFQHGV